MYNKCTHATGALCMCVCVFVLLHAYVFCHILYFEQFIFLLAWAYHVCLFTLVFFLGNQYFEHLYVALDVLFLSKVNNNTHTHTHGCHSNKPIQSYIQLDFLKSLIMIQSCPQQTFYSHVVSLLLMSVSGKENSFLTVLCDIYDQPNFGNIDF